MPWDVVPAMHSENTREHEQGLSIEEGAGEEGEGNEAEESALEEDGDETEEKETVERCERGDGTKGEESLLQGRGEEGGNLEAEEEYLRRLQWSEDEFPRNLYMRCIKVRSSPPSFSFHVLKFFSPHPFKALDAAMLHYDRYS